MGSYNSKLDYNKLEESLVVANTPMYLYSSFTRNQSILDLGSSHTDKDLIELFYKEFGDIRTFRNIVNLYALIVAISYKESTDVNAFFHKLKNTDLKWATELANIFFSKASFTSITDISAHPNLTITFNTDDVSSEVQNFNFK